MNDTEKFQKRGITRSYSTGPYNKMNETEQWIRISQGCPNKCAFCYEPPQRVVYPVPPIERNIVKIMDMNFLSHHRFLYSDLSKALKEARFNNIRLAWDFEYTDQIKIRNALKSLMAAGYRSRDLTIFMVCNWKIPYEECIKKLYLCAIWSVKVADCYFDGQVSPNIEPIGWTTDQIKDFRKRVRKHNQLVGFGIDPEIIKKIP